MGKARQRIVPTPLITSHFEDGRDKKPLKTRNRRRRETLDRYPRYQYHPEEVWPILRV